MIARMSCPSAAPALVSFPSLHPNPAPATLPATVRLLDPGLAPADAPGSFRPADLPLDAEALTGFVREFERLQKDVKNPQDLALLAKASQGHFFAETAFAVREELEDTLQPERVAKRRLRAAQLTLCLASLLEKTLAETPAAAELETRFRAAMADSLGLEAATDQDEAALWDAALAGPSAPSREKLSEEFGLPWRRMLSPFWAILPPATGLFVVDPDMLATWSEAGLRLASPSAREIADLFGDKPPQGSITVLRETGWRLLGKTRPDAEAPWLDTPRTVVILQP